MNIAKQDLIDALVYNCQFYVHNGVFSYCSMNGDRTNCVKDNCTQVTDFFNTLAKLRDMTREERYKHYYNEGYSAGSFKGYEQAIDKACEWLDCYIDNYLFIDAENKSGIKWDDFINDFRKAMKGGEK